MADNAGTFRYTIRNIYNVTVFNGPPAVVIWKNYNVYLGIYKSTQVEASPLTLRIPIRRRLYTTGQQWIEFYPDASEDIPNDMLEPKGMEAD
jgi:hypothetical protein